MSAYRSDNYQSKQTRFINVSEVISYSSICLRGALNDFCSRVGLTGFPLGRGLAYPLIQLDLILSPLGPLLRGPFSTMNGGAETNRYGVLTIPPHEPDQVLAACDKSRFSIYWVAYYCNTDHLYSRHRFIGITYHPAHITLQVRLRTDRLAP